MKLSGPGWDELKRQIRNMAIDNHQRGPLSVKEWVRLERLRDADGN